MNYLAWNNTIEHKQGGLTGKSGKLLEKVASVLFEATCLNVTMRSP